MLGFLILFWVFLRQHVMLVLLQWCVIELGSQSESDFQMPTPFVLYREWGQHSVDGWAGISGVQKDRHFQKLYLGARLKEGPSVSNTKLIIQSLADV